MLSGQFWTLLANASSTVDSVRALATCLWLAWASIIYIFTLKNSPLALCIEILPHYDEHYIICNLITFKASGVNFKLINVLEEAYTHPAAS